MVAEIPPKIHGSRIPPLYLGLSPRNKTILFRPFPSMKILILLHVHSLLSLLYDGWADAESTGGLIHLWKQVVIIIIFVVIIIIFVVVIIIVIIIFVVVVIIAIIISVIFIAIDLHLEVGLILVSIPIR